MKKVILILEVDDDDAKEAERAARGLSGVNSVWLDVKEKKLTVTGYVDPLDIVRMLEAWSPKLHGEGPAKEPEVKKMR